uniref:Uncharacterized protein n=1 Tax=Fundidesulfovibrio putealis TaxID=270496 RepID=A0A7C4AHC5_9BACT
MAASPYRNTLSLDTDTWVLGSVRPLFSLLELGFDLCVAPRPDFRVEGGKLELLAHAHQEDANTGVLAYGGSPAVRALLDAWLESMAGQDDDAIRPGDHCDQWYFNARIKPGPDYARLRVWNLDPKVWNLRTFALAAALEQDLLPGTRILHARAFETRHFHGLDLAELVAARLGFAL